MTSVSFFRYPWCQEAFDTAKSKNRPIFLSIGYSTCHWCHVMERESFENEEIAKLLNTSFISVKVDREERPDVDKVYMAFVQVTDFIRLKTHFPHACMCSKGKGRLISHIST